MAYLALNEEIIRAWAIDTQLENKPRKIFALCFRTNFPYYVEKNMWSLHFLKVLRPYSDVIFVFW